MFFFFESDACKCQQKISCARDSRHIVEFCQRPQKRQLYLSLTRRWEDLDAIIFVSKALCRKNTVAVFVTIVAFIKKIILYKLYYNQDHSRVCRRLDGENY